MFRIWKFAAVVLCVVPMASACASGAASSMCPPVGARLAGSIVGISYSSRTIELTDRGARYEVVVAPDAVIQSGRTEQRLSDLARGDRIVIVSRDSNSRANWIAVSGPPLKRPVEGGRQ